VTFIGTALWLLTLHYYLKAKWLVTSFSRLSCIAYSFFIVNGILTGTGLAQPVVSYNDQENLGIRLLTIPIEDVVYGFELLLLNFFLYEWFNAGAVHNSTGYVKK
jgi:lycopene cyclase domain-containing protein